MEMVNNILFDLYGGHGFNAYQVEDAWQGLKFTHSLTILHKLALILRTKNTNKLVCKILNVRQFPKAMACLGTCLWCLYEEYTFDLAFDYNFYQKKM